MRLVLAPPALRTLKSPLTPRQTRFQSTLPPRWLTSLRPRLGKCISFGLTPPQTHEAGSVLQEVSRDWRELLAGSEGFLTSKEYRGLYRQEVVWGEMVSGVPYVRGIG